MTKIERDTDGVLENVWKSVGFWIFWNLEIENLNISVDVWQKSSVTPMEFSKKIEIPLAFIYIYIYIFIYFLKSWNRKYEYFVRHVTEIERHTDESIDNICKFLWFFDDFEILKSKILIFH